MISKAFLPQALPIIEIKTENATTKTFVLDGTLDAVPGQFVMAWLPGIDEKPFSLANAAPIALTIAAVGPFSRAVHQRNVGDLLWIRGPLGKGFHLPQSFPQKLLLVGGGYGVAPMLYLAKSALETNHQVMMIIGARRKADLILADAFREIDVPLYLTTEDGSEGIRGRVTDAIEFIFADATARPDIVYACGPTGMLEAIAHACRVEDIPCQLAWESHMRCGIGLCGSCEVGDGWLTCLDGPVFEVNPVEVSPQ